VNEALVSLEREFSALYAPIGRPSIPPEKLLRAMLLQAFYSIRSERQLMERLEYDLLFRWFVGIGVDAAVWDHSVFSKNRDRLLEGDIATRFLAAVLDQPRVKKLLSTEHFTVGLIEAWASLKSFKPRDGSEEPPASGGRNAEADFHGKKRSNETHVSTTDPDARLYRKGPARTTWSDEPSPPPSATSTPRHFTFQPRRVFTSRHDNLVQHQRLSDQPVTTIALTLEVGPVRGHTGFKAVLFHFEFGKLGLELLDPGIQSVDVRLGAIR
jgi:transposase